MKSDFFWLKVKSHLANWLNSAYGFWQLGYMVDVLRKLYELYLQIQNFDKHIL